MARSLRSDYEGAVHHLYGRGNRRQPIFEDDNDCRVFLAKLSRYGGEHGVRILAYCLMINHYHLVIQSLKGELSAFMKRLLGSYTRTYNDSHATVGHVFQGRFGSRRCKSDADAMAAIRYVHLNPVEANLASSAESWPWSSARGFLAGSDPIADIVRALDLFQGIDPYREFMQLPNRYAKRTLEQIGFELLGSGFNALLKGDPKDAAAVVGRRDFAAAALLEGHRRSDVARFLGRSAASITKLLRSELKLGPDPRFN